MKRLPIVLSLLALVAVAASIAYWVLQLYQPPQRPLAAPPPAALPEPSIDAAATLFGGQAAAAVAANYTLTGVVADGGDSVAIIVAEGSPPMALKVGKELVPGVKLAEVHQRYVMLSDGGVMKRIDLPADTRSASVNGGGVPAGGSAPPGGEPPVQAGPVQVPEPVQDTQLQPAPQPQPQPQPAPAPVNTAPVNTAPGGAVQAVPPPAPVQMPPPVRATGTPGRPPPNAQ
jgi:general secretion pathway protein C